MKRTALTLILVMIILTGCLPSKANPPTEADPSVLDATAAAPSLSTGPFLLIQTSFTDFHIIDVGEGTATSFKTPNTNERQNLATNLSPSRSSLLFPLDEKTTAVIDVISGVVMATHQYDSNTPLFNPGLAAEDALKRHPNLGYDNEALTDSLTAAYVQSVQNLRWYRSDRYWLSVRSTDAVSTNLHLDDRQTGIRHQLEDMPGLVADFWVRPGGEKILLKKGFLFEPGKSQDNTYYLVDVSARNAHTIPMPVDSENPSVFWLEPNTLGIIHHDQPVGGRGFSIMDTQRMEITEIVADAFTAFRLFGKNFLLLQTDRDARTTTLSILSRKAETLQSETLDDVCFIHSLYGKQIILNCTNKTLILDKGLQVQPFGEPVAIFSPAPDGNNVIRVNRSGSVYLLDEELTSTKLLPLAGMPVEIRWLPDSSGFLYRTLGRLYVYELRTNKSNLLFESDIFGDYANINAVWVQLDERSFLLRSYNPNTTVCSTEW